MNTPIDFDLKAHLEALTQVPAPSGHEGPMAEFLRAAWADLVDEFQQDGLGGLLGLRRGSGPEPRRRVLLAAHMDAIGLIVSEIQDGFIRTHALGGMDMRVMPMQTVTVHATKQEPRDLSGVFAAAPPHMALSRSKYPQWHELWIDTGLPAEDVNALVQVGDTITFDAPTTWLKGDRVAAPALDNRAGVAIVTQALHLLAARAHTWDVLAVATVQEERGRRGAQTMGYLADADLAVVFDGTFGTQPGVGEDKGFPLADGPTLGRGPNFHPLLLERVQQLASELEIKTQIEALPRDSGTDAWHFQTSRAGVPSVLISFPMRHMHTPSEVLDLVDLRRSARLAAEFIAGLTPDTLDELAWPELDVLASDEEGNA